MGTIAVFVMSTVLGAASASPWTVPPEGSCSPPGGLRGGPNGEDAPPVPFKPVDLIDLASAEVLRSYLPPEIWEHRERFFFEGMQLEVGPCFRDYSPPEFFSEATATFRGQAQLTEDGGLAGHTAGLPFPPDTIDPGDPRAGMKWAWNAQSRYRAGGFRGRFKTSDLIGRVGVAEPFEGEIVQNQLAYRADRAGDGYRVPDTGTRSWVAVGKLFAPFDAREYAWHQSREQASEHERERTDDLHVYLPALRKVRRAPGAGVEGVFVPSFGVRVQASSFAPPLGAEAAASLGAVGAGALPDRIEPKRSGFEGLELRPLLYDYQLLGLQDVLAPINAKSPAYPDDPLRFFGPYGLSWASDRWDLRRAIVLEGTKGQIDPKGGLARVRLWFDLETLYPLYYVSYNRRGEQIDVGYFVGRWSEDRADYPKWPDDPSRPVRVIDPVGEGFANLRLKGSWRRESWDVVSIPKSDREVARSLSIQSIQGGR